MANTFLEKSERAEKAGVSEKILNQYRGEAYFTRACKYAVLVSFFGDVVWLDKNIYNPVQPTVAAMSKRLIL